MSFLFIWIEIFMEHLLLKLWSTEWAFGRNTTEVGLEAILDIFVWLDEKSDWILVVEFDGEIDTLISEEKKLDHKK